MKSVMIFGAGQAGRMIAKSLPADCVLTAYIDNNRALQGTVIDSVPVISINEALAGDGGRPDEIRLAVINREAGPGIEKQIRETGFSGEIHTVHEMRDLIDVRLAALRLIADQIRERNAAGQTAELGVYQGAFAAEISRLFPDRRLYLFDTFEGFDEQDLASEKEIGGRNAHAKPGDFSDTSAEYVIARLPHPEQAYICKGRFPDSLWDGAYHAGGERAAGLPAHITGEEMVREKYALVSLDTDLYEPTLSGLQFFWPRLSPGGAIILHDYNSAQYPGVHRAALEYAEEEGIYPVPLMDIHGTAVFIKGE
ncbi:MAG: class I SAM-dependent methyltransferase [Lachnospiraceae bacterium]|nr:class I SAM-dependent methyltransferase [Lachnospiraceae bacterium]